MSPLLLNVYAGENFSEALEDTTEGIIVNEKHFYNIRYADDPILLTTSIEKLERLLRRVVLNRAKIGLKIIVKKTKHNMIVGRTQQKFTVLSAGHQPLQRVLSF